MKSLLPFLRILCLILFIVSSTFAEKTERQFGDVTAADFEIPEQFTDQDYGAIVLFDHGRTVLDHTFSVVLQVHTRILILDEKEFDRATVKIKYHKDGYVEKIKAKSYQLRAGQIVESKLRRRDVYTEEISEFIRSENFTIPNALAGTIIEYSYNVGTGDFNSLNTWYFQDDIPTVESKYEVNMLNSFRYKQRLSGSHKLADVQFEKSTTMIRGERFLSTRKTFVAKDVPAFSDEPFTTHRRNHISKIRFDLTDYQFPGQYHEQVIPKDFLVLSRNLASSSVYKDIYRNNNFLEEDLAKLSLENLNEREKCKLIYQFVQDEFEVDNEEMSEVMRHMYKERKGWSSDINRILTAMLVKAGFSAYPLRLSTKDHGRVDPLFPAPSSFNYEVCVLKLEDENIFLDASKDFLPFGLLSQEAVNGYALLISEDEPELLNLEYPKPDAETIVAKLNFDDEGLLTGDLQIKREGYAAYDINKEYKLDDELYKRDTEEKISNWKLQTHTVKHKDLDEIVDQITLTSANSISQNKIFTFNPNIIFRIKKNPFSAEKRLHPVSLPSPESKRASLTFTIPEGYKVSKMPESTIISLPDGLGRFMYSVNQLGSSITINSVYQLNSTSFTQDGYFYLKEFFARIVEKHDESIIFEKI